MDDANANRGPQLEAVCITFMTLATVAVSLRIYTRTCILKVFGVEDVFMIAGWCCFLMFVTCALGGVHWGTGRHMATLTPNDSMMALRYWWVCYIAYTTAMIAVKMSVGLTLIRLTPNKIHVRILYSIMGISVITGIVFFFLTVFQCNPVPYFWERALGATGTCLEMDTLEAVTYAYSAVNACTDFTYGLLPIFVIKDLKMDLRTKMMLIPILSMACIASAAVLARMAYIHEFADPDFLYATTDIAIWSCTEQGLAITAGSLATLRPMFRLIKEKLGFTEPEGQTYPTNQQALSPLKRSSHGFAVSSFRSGQGANQFHRMDDLVSDNSRANSAAVNTEQDLEGGELKAEEFRSGRSSLSKSRWQIEKRIDIDIETTSMPHGGHD